MPQPETPQQDVILNLASLLGFRGDDLVVEGVWQPELERLEPLELDLPEPLTWRIRIQRVSGDEDMYLFDAYVAGKARTACRRCLTDVDVLVSTSLLYTLHYEPSSNPLPGAVFLREGENEEDVLVFQRPEVDFGDLFLEMLAVELPITVLCREDCKGLSLEGVNLNEHPEAAQQDDQAEDEATKDVNESPFAVLRDLDV
jgi:uncharacterized protein